MKYVLKISLMLAVLMGTANGAIITLDATDNGWYAQNGVHPNNSKSTWTGTDGNGLFRNSFYNFDVSSLVNATINSAKIVFVASGLYRSQDSFETLQVWDVDSKPGDGYSTAIYNDLMSGELYGQQDVFGKFKQEMPEIIIDLSSVSFDDILSDDFFSVGATVSSLAANAQQVLWWGSEIFPAAKLVIDYETKSVSEPGTLAALAVILFFVSGRVRRSTAL